MSLEGTASPQPALPAKPRLSPRRRRLRWTVSTLAIAAALGLALGVVIHSKKSPQPYRPDEQVAGITSTLAQKLPPDAPKPLFTDVTRAAGLASFRTFIGQRTSQMPEDMGPGVAWGDFNNDGHEDVFLVSAGGPMNQPPEKWAPCELYENLGDGTFRKVEGFPDLRIHGMAAAWGDYDEDGFLDLLVTGYNTLLLFHNEGGTGKFTLDTRFPNLKGFWSGASWGDYDNDRHLDLYVCGYIQYQENAADILRGETQQGSFIPFTLNPASYLPATNLLFHNNGDGTFTEVSAQLKVQNPEGRSLGALWHDFDDDGWLDLYVGNDISDNVFFHNLGGKFEDISHAACVADYRSAMGLAAGDYDRDGADDLYITHWVAQENALYKNLRADFGAKRGVAENGSNGEMQTIPSNASTLQHSNAPTLQRSKAPLRFMDVADMMGVGQMALPYVGWGTEFVDFDGDGWLDLVVANGNTIEFEGPMPRKLKPQEAFLLWNQHGKTFYNLAPLNKSLSEPHVSRGLAVADYDNDGAMDILISDLGEGVRLLHNDMQTGHWLKVRLHSRLQNGRPLGFGDGAKVIAHLGDVGLRRTVSSVSYLSQSSRTVHFGLGNAQQADQLEVRWLGGGTNWFTNLAANTTWEITENDPMPRQFTARKRVSAKTAVPALTNSPDARARAMEFWRRQRAAMNALKVEKDFGKAVQLFQEALALDPKHEDSRYYLAHCFAAQGDVTNALAQLEELQRLNAQSHRAFQQWGCLRALFASSDADLAAAEKALERAHALNPEETGALLLLGEVSLLRGHVTQADERLGAACRSNPKAAGGFFLRGYLAWKRGDQAQAGNLLQDTRRALGKDWQPKGATSEGDVQRKQHLETSPLSRYWESWDGLAEPAKSYATLDARLSSGP